MRSRDEKLLYRNWGPSLSKIAHQHQLLLGLVCLLTPFSWLLEGESSSTLLCFLACGHESSQESLSLLFSSYLDMSMTPYDLKAITQDSHPHNKPCLSMPPFLSNIYAHLSSILSVPSLVLYAVWGISCSRKDISVPWFRASDNHEMSQQKKG